jgi:hypothetical protein
MCTGSFETVTFYAESSLCFEISNFWIASLQYGPIGGSWSKTVNDTIVSQCMMSRNCHVQQCPMCTGSFETVIFCAESSLCFEILNFWIASLQYGPIGGSWSKTVNDTIVVKCMKNRSCHVQQWSKTVNDTIVVKCMKNRSCHVQQCPMFTGSFETVIFWAESSLIFEILNFWIASLQYGPIGGSWSKTVNDTIVVKCMNNRSCHVQQCPMCTGSFETVTFWAESSLCFEI